MLSLNRVVKKEEEEELTELQAGRVRKARIVSLF